MIEDLISKLREQGAQIRLQGDRVVCDAPPNVMTPEFVEKLRDHKEQIVALLSKEAMAATADESVIPIISRKMEIPLSFGQESLWFLDQLEPGTAVYNIPLRLRLLVEVDEHVLQKSLNEIVRRHETLRTCFRNFSGRPIQVIEEAATLSLSLIDLTDVPEQVREAHADQLCREQAERPFALGRDLMLRAVLYRLEKDKHILFLNVHHIVFDGWSTALLLREIATLYDAFSKGHPSPLRELPVQYADFAVWQRGRLTGELLTRQLEYWRRQLDGAPPLLELPTEWPRPPVQTFRGSVETATIPPSMAIALKALGQRARVSLFMTLLAAFQTFLYRYSGQQDIIVGSPIAIRSRAELEGLIGLFINTLPLRVDLSGNPTFRQLLSRVSEVVLGAYENQDVPFEKLVEGLQPARNLSYAPLFQVLFSVQNASPGLVNFGAQLDVISSGTSKFDLSLCIKEISDGMIAEVEYCTDLFGYETIRRMLKHFLVLLNGIVENPDEHINSLPLLSVEERQHLLAECNQTAVKYDRAQYLDKLFEDQAKATPERVAVRFGEDLLTYQELDDRADEVSNHLRMLGVCQNELVGLCVERSLDMVVGLIAILKAGGAYLPLDPHYPRDRLAFMLEDARPIVVLTKRQVESALPLVNAKLIFIDELPQLGARHAANVSTRDRRPSDLAYVIYTSGSTGSPKGVQIAHRSIVNFLHSMQEKPGLTANDALLAVTTLSFDIAALEFFLPLTVGALVIIASPEATADATQLVKLLERHRITVMQATPTMWRLLLEINWSGSPNLKILCGGEAWSSKLAEQLLPRCGSLWNMYGPTETTVWSSVRRIERDERVLIGPPIANTSFYVLQPDLQLAPPLVPGELHIGGAGLARGYLNRPELTAEKFVVSPFSHDAEERLYKTGDLVRYLPNGAIEFIGRTDYQVKIRGFRIELEEIATYLRRHFAVKDAVVVVQEGLHHEQQLVAYVVANESQQIEGDELQTFLKRQLPTYMVPSLFEVIERFPMTPAGKIDRKALQKTPALRSGRERLVVLPRNATEGTVAKIWSDILGIENVGIYDDFFDLGGHSLMIVRVLYQINATLRVRLGVPDLFRNPTVEQLAAVIDSRQFRRVRQPEVVLLQEGGSEVPLYFIYAGPDEFQLARSMGTGRSVYGIEVPWPMQWRRAIEANRVSSFPNMEQFVTPFVKVLFAHVGTTPCMLAGHSFAALVAFETARQLIMRGGNVESVMIFDKWARYPAPFQVAWKNLRQCWMERPTDPKQGFAKSIINRFRHSALIIWWPLRIIAGAVSESLWPKQGQLTTSFDEEGVPLPWGLLARLYADIEKKYCPPPALDCRGIIFRTEFTDLNQSVRVLDESLGWHQLFTRGSTSFSLSGDHMSIFREQSQSLALMINSVLKQRDNH